MFSLSFAVFNTTKKRTRHKVPTQPLRSAAGVLDEAAHSDQQLHDRLLGSYQLGADEEMSPPGHHEKRPEHVIGMPRE